MSCKPLVFIQSTENEDFVRGFNNTYTDRLKVYFDLVTANELAKDQSKSSRVQGAVLSPSKYPVIAPFLSDMTSLKVVSTISTGMDSFPIEEFIKRGVKVGNAPAFRQQNKSIADFAVLLMLAVTKNFVTELGYKDGLVAFTLNRQGHDVTNKTLGIVGLGSIGTQLAKRAAAFDMKILYHNRNKRPDVDYAEYFSSLDTMLPLCDVVAICCPYNEKSANMFDKEQFNMMKPTAVIINISRGKIIQTDALVKALQTGEIAGAGLDVTDPEPLPQGHLLFTLPNVIVTPHCSSHTVEAKVEVWDMVIGNLRAGIEGKPLPYEVFSNNL